VTSRTPEVKHLTSTVKHRTELVKQRTATVKFEFYLSALKSTRLTAEALKNPNAPLSKLVGGEAGLGE